MKIKQIRFITSATSPRHYPDYSCPEFAFMGRSNVGKSSLINMLTGRKDLVKVGGKPGVTTTINFFLLNETISLVDLPGFGYARLPKETRKTFLPMIKEYVGGRMTLKTVFLLIDIRRTPDDFERELIEVITGRSVPVAIVATKGDKISRNLRKRALNDISKALGLDPEYIFISSAKTGEGKREILSLVREFSA
ncbi:MAG TPA: YihA family ribosome biogenesis GTP-binding protein [Spirochaetes bacterium]|nr:YihA family ribosome biogenesis GTP-binding protein [Spirochaetota bacterium]